MNRIENAQVTSHVTNKTAGKATSMLAGKIKDGQAAERTKPSVTDSLRYPPAGNYRYNTIKNACKPHPIESVPKAKVKASIRKKITETFVTARHFQEISRAAKQGNFAVSFRESGGATLARLNLGAPAKGHDILEKTIKPSSLFNYYGTNIPTELRNAGIEGYVGHWGKSGLEGIYLSPEVKEFMSANSEDKLNLASKITERPDGHGNTHFILPLDGNSLTENLSLLKAIPDWEKLPFTGDYDTHEMISFTGGKPHVVVEGSNEETFVRDMINACVSSSDTKRPFQKTENNVVRHGPQHNYIAHMGNNERGAPLIGAVARPSFPLAFCDRGNWSIVDNAEQLTGFYKDRGIEIKTTWQPGTDHLHIKPLERGQVTLARSVTADF